MCGFDERSVMLLSQCVCVGVCGRSEDAPPAAETVPDCHVLLEPTLLGPLGADGGAVSLSVLLSTCDPLPTCCLSGSELSYFLFPTSFPF